LPGRASYRSDEQNNDDVIEEKGLSVAEALPTRRDAELGEAAFR
jgi:hypothetical protein